MELTVGDRPVRPPTADEVLPMVDAGLLAGERVELLQGALTEVSPQDAALAPGAREAESPALDALLAGV